MSEAVFAHWEITRAKNAGQKANPHGGLCQCGCGEPAPIATQTDSRIGVVKGQPRKYILGHNRKNWGPDYLEEDCGYETPCWVWQKGKIKAGYGMAWSGGELIRAHRLYYERAHGAIPPWPEFELDHLCENKACVNPSHLEAVSHQENMRRALS